MAFAHYIGRTGGIFSGPFATFDRMAASDGRALSERRGATMSAEQGAGRQDGMGVAELARMRSLKTGAVLLTVWSALNFAVAVGVTIMTLAGTTPIVTLVFGQSHVQGLDPRLIAIVSAQATFCNPCVAALCVLVTVLVWRGLMARARWAWWALAGTLLPLQLFGFVSDTFIGGHNLSANLASLAMLVSGLALAAWGLFANGEPQRS